VPDVLVLCYHAVSPSWPSELAVRPEDLEHQITTLLERGYTATTFTEAVTAPQEGRCLAVTFDDGFRSVHAHALPVLRALGVPATLFVPTAYMGTGQLMAWSGIDQWVDTEWEPELMPCSWEELRELRDAGWEIGSHTVSHPYLTQLTDADLAAELEVSRATLRDRLGGDCTSVAYPYGDVDDRVAEAAGRAGYWAAAALPDRWGPRPRPLEWPRLMVGREDGPATFRRRSSRGFRRLQGSQLWSLVPFAVRIAQRLRRSEGGPVYQGLRLVADGGRIGHGRWGSLALATGQGYALWPTARMPVYVLPLRDRGVARWMQRTFEPLAGAAARLRPELWHLLRSRAVIVPSGPGSAVAVAERALDRPLPGARLATFSPTGSPLAKATCFVFEAGADEPALVIKTMAARSQEHRFAHELDVVETLRERLAAEPEAAAALPLAPLWRGHLGGDLLIAEPVDPLAARSGAAGEREAHAWLRRFQAATTTEVAPWDAADTAAALGAVRQAWGFGRPRSARALTAAVTRRIDAVTGTDMAWCAVHGDFWRGNLAGGPDALRVYDWEWARLRGRPYLDLWTWELADLRDAALGLEEEELATRMRAAIERVEQRLTDQGLDPAIACATAAPALAELSFRIRALTGSPGGNEPGAMRVMAALEQVL
jgi:peptidoglycan/xylan/chitin deacetylase (PgdA/CDA1 family)